MPVNFRQSLRTPAELSLKVKKEIAKDWRTFQFRRYRRFSQGQGTWKPVKKLSGFILRDTDTMMNALRPVFRRRRGQHMKMNKKSVTLGFGGKSRHPKAKMSVAKLAEIHDPVRPVLGKLNKRTKRKIKARVKNDLRGRYDRGRRGNRST